MVGGRPSRAFERARAALLADEPFAPELLPRISEALAGYLQAQLDAGADALQIFDSWAGALAPSDYARLGAPYIARVVQGLRRDRKQPAIVFGVETGGLLAQLAAPGADGGGGSLR